MKNVKKLLAIPYMDKILHFIAGFLIALTMHLVFKAEIWTSFGLAMTMGLIKEMVYDFFWKGHVSWKDWFATIAGALVGVWIL